MVVVVVLDVVVVVVVVVLDVVVVVVLDVVVVVLDVVSLVVLDVVSLVVVLDVVVPEPPFGAEAPTLPAPWPDAPVGAVAPSPLAPSPFPPLPPVPVNAVPFAQWTRAIDARPRKTSGSLARIVTGYRRSRAPGKETFRETSSGHAHRLTLRDIRR